MSDTDTEISSIAYFIYWQENSNFIFPSFILTEPPSVDIHMCLECLCEFKVPYETEIKLRWH